ncbi:MAG: histidine phosphatase family protein [Actinomycetota bacterium]|nr:MAG: histidine phosphatase family protein [Actinomycetota bacterium]
MNDATNLLGPFQSDPNGIAHGSIETNQSGPRVARSSRSTNITRIYLVRHGQTELNVSGVLRGHLDPKLDALGILQARLLGEVLGREELQLIVSSPLKRAVETAAEIAKCSGVKLELDPRLVDRDYGPWAGKAKEAVIATWGSLNAAPDIEPESEVLARALEATIDVSHRVPNGSAVMVSHDAVNRLLLFALDTRLENASTPQETGCFNIIELQGNDWSVLSVNSYPSRNGIPLIQQSMGDEQIVDAIGEQSVEPHHG